MKNIMFVIKGFIMGIANIIPGVSGGTLALTLGIYERLIEAVSHFFSNVKENLKFIIPIFIGMGLSILSMSNVISYSFEHFSLQTALLFMGLVFGGIPLLYKKVSDKEDKNKLSNYLIFCLTFILVLILAFSNEIFGSGLGDITFDTNIFNLIKILLVGIVAASTMIIPGVSGSLVLMLIGYYTPVINGIKEFTHFENIFINILNLGFFGVGVLVGIVLVAKLIEWLFERYKTKTYFGVLGFISSSIIAIPVSVIHEYGNFNIDLFPVIIGSMLFLIGILIGNKLGDE